MNAVLIGFGYWGPNIARNLSKSKEFTFHGICDADEKKIEKAKSLYGDRIRYYTDYRDVLRDDSVGMCAVALRNDIAQQVARDVLRSGRHLFMEKPMATKMEDALALKELAEKNGVLLHVDHILVFHPIIRRIKSIIDSGELGELVFFESNRANLGPHIKNDMNAMWDLAVHDLAILDYLCGGKQAKKADCVGVKKFGKQEALTYLTICYDDFVAMIKSSWISPLKERTIIVSGTNKMIVFDDLKESEKLMIYDKGVDINKQLFEDYGEYEAKVRLGDLFVPNIEPEDSLQNSLKHFAGCISSGCQSIAGPDQAIRTLRILEEAEKCLGQNEVT